MNNREYPESEGLQVVPPGQGLEARYDSMQKYPAPPPVVYEKAPNYTQGPNHHFYNDAAPPAAAPAAAATPRVCGVKRKTFWIVLGIALVVVIGAAVGGGVGATVGKSSSSSPSTTTSSSTSVSSTTTSSSQTTSSSTTTTSSSSTTTAQTAYPTTKLALDCPAINATQHNAVSALSSTTYTFNVYCNVNFAAGLDSAGRNTSSVNECMQSCADFAAAGGVCVGVVWDSVMNLALTPRRNCFLKTSTSGLVITGTSQASAGGIIVT